MIKTQLVSKELKNFNSLFNKFMYSWDASNIFDDFLSIFICCFARGTQEDWYFDVIKRYKKEELNIFAQMMAELLILYSNAKQNNDWIDPLGEYYEILASNHKKSSFGQFFTPKPICDLMTQFSLQNADWDKTVNDPTCGSGRTLLSANQHTKDMTYIGQDLDPVCAKMAAINLCMHQMKGTIYCMDTLRMTEPKKTYAINPNFHKHNTLLILCK